MLVLKLTRDTKNLVVLSLAINMLVNQKLVLALQDQRMLMVPE